MTASLVGEGTGVTVVTAEALPSDVDCPHAERDGRRRVGRALRSRVVQWLIPVLVAAFIGNVVLTQRRAIDAALSALGRAQWVWLPTLVAAGASTYLMSAVVLNAASGRRLIFRRTLSVQVAAAFTNRLAPGGLGGIATNVRYLERSGHERADAMSTVGIAWAAGIVVHVAVVITVGSLFWLRHGDSYRPDLPSADYCWVAGVVISALSALAVLAWRCLKVRMATTAAKLRSNISGLRQRPGDLGRLACGSAGMTSSHMLALVLALQAFGGGVSVLSIAVVYLAATAFAAALPIPGGVGSIETALAAGLVAVGAAGGAAVAAVLTYRLITFWLPIIPGVLIFRSLRRRRIL